MSGKAFLQRLGSPRKTRNSIMAQAHADSDHSSSTTSSAGLGDNASAPSSSTPSNTSTPIKQKSTPSSTPKSKKRKSRTNGYADDSDSEYRAHTSSRKSSRRTRRASFGSDPDGDYGGSVTPTRKMTRPILSRYSYQKLISSANGEEVEEDGVDEREGLCLEKCPFYENPDMIECDRYQCGRKFHLGCVGFSAKPTLGENKWWFCPECRKIEERGEKTNGLYALGDSEDEDDGE